MVEKLDIRVKLGSRTYSMNILRADESFVRERAKKFDFLIKKYQENFDINDMQDTLAMVAFDTFIEENKKERSCENMEEYAMEEIAKLNRQIGAVV